MMNTPVSCNTVVIGCAVPAASCNVPIHTIHFNLSSHSVARHQPVFRFPHQHIPKLSFMIKGTFCCQVILSCRAVLGSVHPMTISYHNSIKIAKSEKMPFRLCIHDTKRFLPFSPFSSLFHKWSRNGFFCEKSIKPSYLLRKLFGCVPDASVYIVQK